MARKKASRIGRIARLYGSGARTGPLLFLSALPVELALKVALDQPPPGQQLVRQAYHYGLMTLDLSHSFPSGHSSRAAFAAVFVGYLVWRVGPGPVVACAVLAGL